jgi:hypothetical protein
MAGSGWVGAHVGGRAFETMCGTCRILWPFSTGNPVLEVRLLRPLRGLCGGSLRIAREALVLASLRLERSGREEVGPVWQVRADGAMGSGHDMSRVGQSFCNSKR